MIRSQRLPLALLLFLAATTSCSREPTPAEASGGMSLALRATGPDGLSYRLPMSAYFDLERPGLVFRMDLGTGEPELVLPLQVGSYVGRARDSAADADPAGVSWRLLRVEADGSTTPVPATLHDTSVPFQVVAGHTTPVMLRFTVHAVGDVVFQVGRVNVSIAVTQDVAAAGGVALAGSMNVTGQSLEAGDAVNAVLAAPAGTTAMLALTARLNGPWQHYLHTVCTLLADVAVTARGDHVGLRDWLLHLDGAPQGSLCFTTSGSVILSVFRTGPIPSSLAGLLAGDHRSQLTVYGFGPATTWDGERLALSALTDPTALTRAYAVLTLSQAVSPFAVLATTNLDAPVSLRFTP